LDASGFGGVGNYSWGHGYREWATAELWESTGDPDVLAAIEGQLFDPEDGEVVRDLPRNWDWADARALAIYTYLLSEREGRTPEIVDAVTADLLTTADELESDASEHGYGRPLPMVYYWGSNGVLLRTGMTLEVAYRLTGEERYRTAELASLDFVLGRNYFARSFVTRVGNEPPISPHHRPSQADRAGAAWPGLLIGGPNDQEDAYDYDGRAWVDRFDNYFTNEVAINWNAALIYALAGWPSAAPVVEE
jgi:endoglucanase